MQRKGLADQLIRSKMFPSRLSNGLLLVCLGKFYFNNTQNIRYCLHAMANSIPFWKKPLIFLTITNGACIVINRLRSFLKENWVKPISSDLNRIKLSWLVSVDLQLNRYQKANSSLSSISFLTFSLLIA